MRGELLTVAMMASLGLGCVTDSRAEITETPLSFVINEEQSSLSVDGSVIGLDLRGDRTTAIGGTIDLRVGMEDDRALGFILDDSVIIQMDFFRPEVANPIPFLPPLATLEIEGLTLSVRIDTTGFQGGGEFVSDGGSFEILTGMVSVNGLGFEIDDLDLAGIGADGIPIAGEFELMEDMVRLGFPLELSLELEDLGYFSVSGRVVGYAPY